MVYMAVGTAWAKGQWPHHQINVHSAPALHGWMADVPATRAGHNNVRMCGPHHQKFAS